MMSKPVVPALAIGKLKDEKEKESEDSKEHAEALLDNALRESFPASDSPAPYISKDGKKN